jgi:3-hydroxypropanoate dehydrogenase
MTASTERSVLGRLDERGQALLFTEARTANNWADIPVTDEELTEIWELAKWPPTSGNIQPLRVVFVRPGAGRDRLVEHMAKGNKVKTAAAPAVAVLAVDTQFHEYIPAVFPHCPERKDAFVANEELRLETGSFNATLQVGYFVLAVRARGLAAGPMSGFDHAGLDADFFPAGRLRSILVVNIGHPGENARHPRLPRLEHDEVISWALSPADTGPPGRRHRVRTGWPGRPGRGRLPPYGGIPSPVEGCRPSGAMRGGDAFPACRGQRLHGFISAAGRCAQAGRLVNMSTAGRGNLRLRHPTCLVQSYHHCQVPSRIVCCYITTFTERGFLPTWSAT